MVELTIGPQLVGARVQLGARPEWGAGTVLRVQAVRENGQAVHRLSVQFASGHRTLLAPPARLFAPQDEPQRGGHGWLDQLAGNTLDDRLRALPASVTDVLGGPRERMLAMQGLFVFSSDPAGLLKWARAQTGVHDPLAHWSRDELSAAFGDFCAARDAYYRELEARAARGPRDRP